MGNSYGFWALIPPIVAIALCFKTKMVLVSLFVGVFAIAFVLNKVNSKKLDEAIQEAASEK